MDDRSLVERSITGDDGAFRMLVAQYENLVWDLLNRMVPNGADREELAQDVFLKAYFNLKRFRFESKFSTWLYTIAYRVALSYLRKFSPDMVELDNSQEQWQDESEGSGEQLEVVQLEIVQRELVSAIDRLSVDERTVITLFHLHNCTIDEIATIVDKPDGTVKNQLFRARKKLKGFLQSEDL